jgi:signal transduction histidine kinase
MSLPALSRSSVRKIQSTGRQPISALYSMNMNEPLEPIFHEVAPAFTPAGDKKKQMIAVVSHELRSPLTAIHGSLSLLASGALGQLSDQAQSMLDIAERNAARLLELVDDLLDVEKLESGELQMQMGIVNTQSLTDRSMEAIQTLADRHGIQLKRPQQHFDLCADGDRLVQVLVNLLSNAIKFSPDGSCISIDIIKHPGSLEFCISDKGRGIPAECQNRIFERFNQIQGAEASRAKGSGLGLWICRRIVEAHRGSIGVDSAMGQGSTFWFCIPTHNSAGRRTAARRDTQKVRALAAYQSNKLPAANLKNPHLPTAKLND